MLGKLLGKNKPKTALSQEPIRSDLNDNYRTLVSIETKDTAGWVHKQYNGQTLFSGKGGQTLDDYGDIVPHTDINRIKLDDNAQAIKTRLMQEIQTGGYGNIPENQINAMSLAASGYWGAEVTIPNIDQNLYNIMGNLTASNFLDQNQMNSVTLTPWINEMNRSSFLIADGFNEYRAGQSNENSIAIPEVNDPEALVNAPAKLKRMCALRKFPEPESEAKRVQMWVEANEIEVNTKRLMKISGAANILSSAAQKTHTDYTQKQQQKMVDLDETKDVEIQEQSDNNPLLSSTSKSAKKKEMFQNANNLNTEPSEKEVDLAMKGLQSGADKRMNGKTMKAYNNRPELDRKPKVSTYQLA